MSDHFKQPFLVPGTNSHWRKPPTPKATRRIAVPKADPVLVHRSPAAKCVVTKTTSPRSSKENVMAAPAFKSVPTSRKDKASVLKPLVPSARTRPATLGDKFAKPGSVPQSVSRRSSLSTRTPSVKPTTKSTTKENSTVLPPSRIPLTRRRPAQESTPIIKNVNSRVKSKASTKAVKKCPKSSPAPSPLRALVLPSLLARGESVCRGSRSAVNSSAVKLDEGHAKSGTGHIQDDTFRVDIAVMQRCEVTDERASDFILSRAPSTASLYSEVTDNSSADISDGSSVTSATSIEESPVKTMPSSQDGGIFASISTDILGVGKASHNIERTLPPATVITVDEKSLLNVTLSQLVSSFPSVSKVTTPTDVSISASSPPPASATMVETRFGLRRLLTRAPPLPSDWSASKNAQIQMEVECLRRQKKVETGTTVMMRARAINDGLSVGGQGLQLPGPRGSVAAGDQEEVVSLQQGLLSLRAMSIVERVKTGST